MNCEPTIEKATATEFVMTNKKKPQNFILGELTGGDSLSFIIENLPKDGMGCRGWWMFDMMMQHFGTSVAVIHGSWTYGDNLAMVNKLTTGGVLLLEEAAKHGPTGKYAAAWNFTRVEVQPQTVGTPGNYVRVHVLFKK